MSDTNWPKKKISVGKYGYAKELTFYRYGRSFGQEVRRLKKTINNTIWNTNKL